MKRAFKAVESLLLRHSSKMIASASPTTPPERKRRCENEDSDSEETFVVSNKRRRVEKASIKRSISSPQSVLVSHDSSLIIKKVKKEETASIKRSISSPQTSLLLKKIPSEVVLHVMTYLTCVSDYGTLQTVCTQFRDLTDMNCILRELDVTTQKGAVIMDADTPDEAQRRLCKFAKALNLEAIYMLGMIRAYCYEDVGGAVSLLTIASNRGHLKSSYALGLMLRDNQKDESTNMLLLAAQQGYLPAQQEVFPASVVKSKHGELEAEELVNYLDPPCLSNLLNREFRSNVRYLTNDTSHCWNPHCGRWAYKQHAHGCVKTKDLDPTVASVLTCVDIPKPFKIQKVSRMKMCSSCRQAKYCSKLCQVFDWRSNRHKAECTMLNRGDFDRREIRNNGDL